MRDSSSKNMAGVVKGDSMRNFIWPIFGCILFLASTLALTAFFIWVNELSESELASAPQQCYLAFEADANTHGVVLALLPADCPPEE